VETSAPGMEGYWLARGDFLIKRGPLAASRNRFDSSTGYREPTSKRGRIRGAHALPSESTSLLTSLPGLGHKISTGGGILLQFIPREKERKQEGINPKLHPGRHFTPQALQALQAQCPLGTLGNTPRHHRTCNCARSAAKQNPSGIEFYAFHLGG